MVVSGNVGVNKMLVLGWVTMNDRPRKMKEERGRVREEIKRERESVCV